MVTAADASQADYPGLDRIARCRPAIAAAVCEVAYGRISPPAPPPDLAPTCSGKMYSRDIPVRLTGNRPRWPSVGPYAPGRAVGLRSPKPAFWAAEVISASRIATNF